MEEKMGFVEWAIGYLDNNLEATNEQFTNWFMGASEGIEGLTTYDGSYWQNPNLSFSQQPLPTKANFIAAYPPKTLYADQLCSQIGGQIQTLYNNIIASGHQMNTCAIRMSKALNTCGITIPNIPGRTKSGADGENYFTFAADLNAWLMFTFGISTNSNGFFPLNDKHLYLDDGGPNGENFQSSLSEQTGIFCMIPINSQYFGATGHCDALIDGTCVSKCYFPSAIGIHVWILD